jgi:hypothetical protein
MKSIIFSRYARFALIFLLCVGLFSCYKDRFALNKLETGGTWSPDMAAPLINSTLTLKDILDDYDHDNLFVTSGTGFLTLVYTNNVFSQKAEDILVINDQNMNTSFQFSVTGTLPVGLDVTAPVYQTSYSFVMPNNAIIDELDLKSGSFNFSITSPDLNCDATVQVNIPSATLGGTPFNQAIYFTAGSTAVQPLSLAGYKILLDNTGGNVNRLNINYTVTLHGNGSTNNSPYNINMGESFNNLKFSKILGDFKQIPFVLSEDTIAIRIFSKNIHGMIDFADPKVHMIAYNSFGMPIRININSFKATSGWNSPYEVTLTGTGIPSPWNINAPSVIGQVIQTQFDLDRNNSNIWDAIAISPQKFLADFSGLSNPAGGISSNFALDTSRLKVDAQIEIPLYGKAWDFVLGDTNELDLGDNLDKVEFMTFRIHTLNGFPVEAIQQMIFLDSLNHPIDSLLTPEQQTMTPAPTNGSPDYRVTSPVMKVTETTLYKDRITLLQNCKKMFIRTKLMTTNYASSPVKFYSDYNVNVRIAVRVKFNIEY